MPRRAHSPRQFPTTESILGPVPLFEGEDPKAYKELLKNVRAAITPPNFLVELLVSDVVAHTWQIPRLRRYEVELSKELEDSEKIHRADPSTELSIKLRRLARVQQMIAVSEQRRLKALKQIEYLCTKFAKALRIAVADAEDGLSESAPSKGSRGANSKA